MSGSIRFDRAADQYDRTRAISDEAMGRTISLLAAELRDRGRVLEVGVGTGLLALRLHEVGIPVSGVDLSAPMLAKLVHKAGGAPPFPLVRGDATTMPFADRAFGAVYLRWVLHLIPDWRAALAEMARVVRPGGVLVVSLGAFDEVGRAVRARFSEITGLSTEPVGLMWADHDALDAALEGLGLRLRVLPAIPEEEEEPLGSFLDAIEEGRWSWTWHVPEEARVHAVRELRPWAEERFGPLDRIEGYSVETVWRAYDLPGQG
ncbi:MAG TPA: class I SAM-dependent methyltransferase [Actinomycetota bacterium]|nr:class I SAM-dependent methyltransferase [Actinomycetota bacterium]